MARSINLKSYVLFDINNVIRFLTVSDVVIVGSAGLLGPIFALYIEDFIAGGNAAVAGMAAAIYLITRSIAQIPTAILIDKIKGEKDDFYFMFIFSIITSILPLAYLFVETALGLYIVQAILGIGTAFTYPSYMAIFTRHIDKNKEGMEWGVYFTLVDLSSAGFAAIGGYIATTLGFPILITVVVIIGIIGSMLLFPVKKYLKL